MNKKVSIITPSYNSAKYIKQTIDSVRAQTYTDWEMLIVDDCSTDNTCDIVEAIAKEDNRVKLIRQEQNGGAAVARNRALENSTGRFIAYLDADDIWLPEKLSRQVEFMEQNDVAFSCCDFR